MFLRMALDDDDCFFFVFGGQLWWAYACTGNLPVSFSLANKVRSFVRSYAREPLFFAKSPTLALKFSFLVYANGRQSFLAQT